MEEDKELGFHYDASEVTLNVCLGKEFEGKRLKRPCDHILFAH